MLSGGMVFRLCSSMWRVVLRGARSSRDVYATLPEGFTDLLPELNQQPGDIVVTKRTWGAFSSTDLERQLKAKGVTQVVLAWRGHRNRRGGHRASSV